MTDENAIEWPSTDEDLDALYGYALVGDVKTDISQPNDAREFTRELRALMLKYRVDRIDIGWARPTSKACRSLVADIDRAPK